MNSTVAISDFRKNLFNYVDLAARDQRQLGVTSGKKLVGWFVTKETKTKKKRSKVDLFLEEIEKLQKKYPIHGGKNLSRDIDKILYGEK